MKEIELCEMCAEYSKGEKCENKANCKLLAILKENKILKQKNKKLKDENANLSMKMSYMVDSNAIGFRNDMGW